MTHPFAGTFTWFDVIGFCGFACYVANYTMLTLKLIAPANCTYFVINLCAASLVLTSLSVNYNAASALVQTFFIAMSLIGLFLRLQERRRLRRGDWAARV